MHLIAFLFSLKSSNLVPKVKLVTEGNFRQITLFLLTEDYGFPENEDRRLKFSGNFLNCLADLDIFNTEI